MKLAYGVEKIGISIKDSLLQSGVARLLAFPFAINYLIGKKKNFLELGAGATYVFASAKNKSITNTEDYSLENFNLKLSNLYGTFNIGYRHIPYNKGVMYIFY